MKPVTENFGGIFLFVCLFSKWKPHGVHGAFSLRDASGYSYYLEASATPSASVCKNVGFFHRHNECLLSCLGSLHLSATGLCFATCCKAHHIFILFYFFLQLAKRRLSYIAALLEEKKQQHTLLFCSMPFSRRIFKHQILKSTGDFQKLCSALGFTFNITKSQVRPVPRSLW